MSKKLVAVLCLFAVWFTLSFLQTGTEYNFTTGASRECLYFGDFKLRERPLPTSEFELIPVDPIALGLPAEETNWRRISRDYPFPEYWHRTFCSQDVYIRNAIATTMVLLHAEPPDQAIVFKEAFLVLLNAEGAEAARDYVNTKRLKTIRTKSGRFP